MIESPSGITRIALQPPTEVGGRDVVTVTGTVVGLMVVGGAVVGLVVLVARVVVRTNILGAELRCAATVNYDGVSLGPQAARCVAAVGSRKHGGTPSPIAARYRADADQSVCKPGSLEVRRPSPFVYTYTIPVIVFPKGATVVAATVVPATVVLVTVVTRVVP